MFIYTGAGTGACTSLHVHDERYMCRYIAAGACTGASTGACTGACALLQVHELVRVQLQVLPYRYRGRHRYNI